MARRGEETNVSKPDWKKEDFAPMIEGEDESRFVLKSELEEARTMWLKWCDRAELAESDLARTSGYLTEQYNLNATLVEKVGQLETEVERLRTGNAALVDQHNRESHGTASHEAIAYDALKEEVQHYARMSGLNYSRLREVEEERDALQRNWNELCKMHDAAVAERDSLKAENERLRAWYPDEEFQALLLECDALKAEVERLRNVEMEAESIVLNTANLEAERGTLKAEAAKWERKSLDLIIVNETLEARVSRLRKAVNWMRGCFNPETWEYKRATAVLEEEK